MADRATGRSLKLPTKLENRCTLMREETEKTQMHSMSFTKDINLLLPY